MGFLLLQCRPGGEYLEAFSRPFNFVFGGFGTGGREREREKGREKASVYQSRLDLASFNHLIAHFALGGSEL